jgi:hypothetical protein
MLFAYPFFLKISLLTAWLFVLQLTGIAQSVSLIIDPAVTNVTAGQTFTVDVKVVVSGSPNIGGIAVYLNYNSTYLQALSLMPQASSILPVELLNDITTTAGQIDYFAGKALNSNPNIQTANFILFKLQFKALQAITGTPLSFSFNAMQNRTTAAEAPGAVNILSGTTGGTVNITCPNITATLTPQPSEICPGDPVNLTVNITGGTGPYTLVINGRTYSNVTNGSTITMTDARHLWNNSVVPPTSNTPPLSSPANNIDGSAVELGVNFRTQTAGKIYGIRFYKGNLPVNAMGDGPLNAPYNLTYTVYLWNYVSSSPVASATVAITDQTPAGWQEVLFATPVTINAGQTYVASYHAPRGRYAFTHAYFAISGFDNPPLRALQNPEFGVTNGVYKYGAGGSPRPNETFNSSNYWADVVFLATQFNLTKITDANGCMVIGNPIATANITLKSIPPCSAYPIDLLDFKGWQMKDKIQLQWNVASQKDNDYMAVERSRDGKQFTEIGRRAGAGTTNLPYTYQLPDDQPLPGINYYRLRQVDFDGQKNYHKTIAVPFKGSDLDFQLFPSPASDYVTIQLNEITDQNGWIRVWDASGRVVRSLPFEPEIQPFQLPVQDLPSGVYVCSLQLATKIYHQKFVKR